MLGLPTETDEDVLGIAKLVYEILKTWREHASNKKRGVRIHVATAFFVPKPFTPFQWEKQITPEEYLRRARLLKDNMPSKSIEYNWARCRPEPPRGRSGPRRPPPRPRAGGGRAPRRAAGRLG